MENLPRPGIELMSPALAGGRLTTGPPGKSWEEDLERGGQPRLSLKAITRIPIRWKQRKSHLEKTRRQRDIRGSDQSDVATSQGSQGLLTTSKSWKRQKGFFPQSLLKKCNLPIPWLQNSRLWNFERIHICCFCYQFCGLLLQQSQEALGAP